MLDVPSVFTLNEQCSGSDSEAFFQIALAQSFSIGRYCVPGVSPGGKAIVDGPERLRFGTPKLLPYSPFSAVPCEEFHLRHPCVFARPGFSTA